MCFVLRACLAREFCFGGMRAAAPAPASWQASKHRALRRGVSSRYLFVRCSACKCVLRAPTLSVQREHTHTHEHARTQGTRAAPHHIEHDVRVQCIQYTETVYTCRRRSRRCRRNRRRHRRAFRCFGFVVVALPDNLSVSSCWPPVGRMFSAGTCICCFLFARVTAFVCVCGVHCWKTSSRRFRVLGEGASGYIRGPDNDVDCCVCECTYIYVQVDIYIDMYIYLYLCPCVCLYVWR